MSVGCTWRGLTEAQLLFLNDDLKSLDVLADVAKVKVLGKAPEIGKGLTLLELLLGHLLEARQMHLKLHFDLIEGLLSFSLSLASFERVKDCLVALMVWGPLTKQLRNTIIALLPNVDNIALFPTSVHKALGLISFRSVKLASDPNRILADLLVGNWFLCVDQVLKGFDLLVLLVNIQAVLSRQVVKVRRAKVECKHAHGALAITMILRTHRNLPWKCLARLGSLFRSINRSFINQVRTRFADGLSYISRLADLRLFFFIRFVGREQANAVALLLIVLGCLILHGLAAGARHKRDPYWTVIRQWVRRVRHFLLVVWNRLLALDVLHVKPKNLVKLSKKTVRIWYFDKLCALKLSRHGHCKLNFRNIAKLPHDL